MRGRCCKECVLLALEKPKVEAQREAHVAGRSDERPERQNRQDLFTCVDELHPTRGEES